jgi:hypothetical protein
MASFPVLPMPSRYSSSWNFSRVASLTSTRNPLSRIIRSPLARSESSM